MRKDRYIFILFFFLVLVIEIPMKFFFFLSSSGKSENKSSIKMNLIFLLKGIGVFLCGGSQFNWLCISITNWVHFKVVLFSIFVWNIAFIQMKVTIFSIIGMFSHLLCFLRGLSNKRTLYYRDINTLLWFLFNIKILITIITIIYRN